jgi:hypothetical protein
MAATPEHASAAATGAPEPQVGQIQYLTPTPPGFAPEYDYFSVVQVLIDTAGLRRSGFSYLSPYQPPEELLKRREDISCRAYLVNSSGLTEWSWLQLPSEITVERMYKEIQYLRRMLTGETQGGTYILVVDRIGPTLLRMLGAAIDLDPTFLWRHHTGTPDHPTFASKMNILRSRFFSLMAAEKKRRSGTDMDYEPSIASSEEERSVHLKHRYSKIRGLARTHGISSHISCYRVSATSRT